MVDKESGIWYNISSISGPFSTIYGRKGALKNYVRKA